jgi:hypothetical protein
MIITREDYLNALELIDLYHQQLNSSNGFSSNKTEITLWITKLSTSPSNRLCNILLYSPRWLGNGEPFKYVEEITKYEFMRLRNAGESTWLEFIKLRDEQKENPVS